MRPTKIYTFTVRGRSYFPLDMLRYDECIPFTEADSLEMNESFFARPFVSRDVTLTSSKPPTEGRWNSFGWNVLPDVPR